MIRSILLLLAVLATLSTVQGYFYEPSFGLGLPFKAGMAAAKRNNSLILFGGENNTLRYSNDMYQLTQSSTGFTWTTLAQTSPPPPSIYSQSVVSSDGTSMMLIGGNTNNTVNQAIPLQIYQYSFASSGWSAWSGNGNTNTSAATPVNRIWFSATYNNVDTVYVYGGAVNESVILSDFWAINVKTQPITFTKLPDPGVPRLGHSASLLSNGKLVIIGGLSANTATGAIGLVAMNNIQVFDTHTNTWEPAGQVQIKGTLPSTRSNFNAFVTSNDQIVILGGDNGASQRQRQYLSELAILDTKTWTWTVPNVNGIPPSRRSYAVGAMLDDTHVTIGFGGAMNIYYNDIDVFDLSSSSWLQSFSSTDGGDSGVSVGMIVGVAVAGVILLAIFIFLLWKFWSYVRWLVVRIHSDIWKPRSGEPIWAETSRIIFQVFFLFLFFVFMAFVIRQAVESPDVIQRIEEASPDVAVPDVRFCFDGYPTYAANDPRNPGVVCQTDTGFPCSQYMITLNMNTFTPTFADNLGPVSCYLFRAPDDFRLTATSGVNNGSRLLFNFFGDQTITTGRVHVSVYPNNMDPNTQVYSINDKIISLLSNANVQAWANNERNDLQATNVYTIEPFTYSAMSFEVDDYRYLQPVGWNYVGFLPIANSTPEVVTNFRQESPNPNYASTHADVGVLAVFPTEYSIVTMRQVKMYTLVNALGFVGGVFGILIALQAWLFGYRPRSPWGVVHRWSVGDMKRSLLRGLQSNFKTSSDVGIPLVHPVNHRFSSQNLGSPNTLCEPEPHRIQHVEERMQVLEMLFKAYYVDDEVFRSLDNANRTNSPSEKRSDNASDKYPLNHGL